MPCQRPEMSPGRHCDCALLKEVNYRRTQDTSVATTGACASNFNRIVYYAIHELNRRWHPRDFAGGPQIPRPNVQPQLLITRLLVQRTLDVVQR